MILAANLDILTCELVDRLGARGANEEGGDAMSDWLSMCDWNLQDPIHPESGTFRMRIAGPSFSDHAGVAGADRERGFGFKPTAADIVNVMKPKRASK